LRDLAAETGTSFTWPSTGTEASKQIRHLLERKKSGRAERRREANEVSREMATRFGDAASVRVDEETGGYGSTAHWR
jgi:hypothetical protein